MDILRRPVCPVTVLRPRAARRWPLRAVPLLVLLVDLVLQVLNPPAAGAHAFLKESDPPANALLSTAPAQVTLRFTEPLERAYSRAELYDQTGSVVPGAASRFVDDRYAMVVDLPAALPNGTYSVLWRTLSTADGHTAEGYVAFTVGTEADVRAVVPPAPATTAGGPPDWVRAISRWLALLGLAATVAVWPTWLFVLRPAISPAWQLGPQLTRRVQGLTTAAVAFAVVGSVVALLVQAATTAGDAGLASAVRTVLFETRYGTLWLVRLGLFLLFAAVLGGCAWWWPWRRPVAAGAALVLGALLPLPFSLIAHAAAQPVGRATSVAFDLLHLLAASLWVGGLFVLVGALAPTLHDLTPVGRRAVLARAIPRFSAIALVTWGVMTLTGVYSAWLQVGNLEALRETAYGRSLIIKLLLLVPLLALAAFNLLVVTRRIRRAEAAGAASAWSRRFVAAIVAESVLVVLVYLIVGRLVGQAPAREELGQTATRVAIPLEANGRPATLTLTPGTVGPNHYRLEVGVAPLPGEAEALLRVELPSHDTGQKQIELVRAAGNAFEGHGSELSITGDWEIQALVRRTSGGDWTARTTRAVGAISGTEGLPAPPWRFGPAGIAGLLLLTLGIAGLVIAWRAGRTPLRKESAGLAAVALVFGAILLLQARVEPGAATGRATTDRVPANGASVERGKALFAANCVTCHGPGGQGNGPAAAGLNPPPADLTIPHSRTHRDEDLFFWIQNGIRGSAMPAFGDELTDQQIQDVITYVRVAFQGAPVSGGVSAEARPGTPTAEAQQ